MKISRIFHKVIAFFFCVAIIIPLLVGSVGASTQKDSPSFPSVSGASNIYLYNFESDSVIYSFGSDRQKIVPASTVKIMTGLLAIEMLENRINEHITLTEEILSGVEGYTVNFEVNMIVRIKDLLYGLICGGGNDAAIVLARICSGSVESFVEQMNLKAVEWGCTDTHYANPTGIDSTGMTTSLRDTVIISKKAIDNEQFLKMCSAQSYSYTPVNSYKEKKIANRNALISTYSAIGYRNNKVKGLNAGMTDRGGYCVSAYATDGENSYLCVVMGGNAGASETISSYRIANTLLNHAFESYSYELIAKKGDKIDERLVDLALPTDGSDEMTVSCILKEDIYAYAPINIDYKKDLTYKVFYYDSELIAPIFENTEIGCVDIYYNGIILGTGKLITEKNVEASGLLVSLNGMKNFLVSSKVILFVVISIVLTSAYIIVRSIKKSNKKSNRR